VLALGGTRAIWAIFSQSNTEDHIEVVSGSVGDHRDLIVGRLTFGGGLEERPRSHFIPMAGDGSTIVYADEDDGSEDTPDRGVRRLVGRGSTRIPGAIGALALAASGRRLALLSDTNGTSIRNASNFAPAWSPLGDRIAYSSLPGDRRFSAIKIVGIDGASPMKITNQTLGEYRADYTPDWSPDGSRLAFVRQEVSTDSNRPGIWTMSADGSNQKRLIVGTDPAWSPDGTKIAFGRETGGISVINADGSGLRDLTSYFRDSRPDWSPDGSMLAFSSATSQNPNEVRVMNSDGTNVHDVAAGQTPAWSGDGRIAFARGLDPSEIRIVNPDGSNDHRVGDGLAPSWSPDGTSLAVTRANSPDSVETDIFILRADGSGETRLTTAKLEPIAPTLQLRDVRSGRLIARVAYRGQGKGIALSPSFAAVLTHDTTGTHVALYNARDGSAAGIVRVRGSATDLSISGTRVVFRSGRSIWMFDARRKHVSLLATAKATPIGLSMEGRRVAWAENLAHAARIRAISVPR